MMEPDSVVLRPLKQIYGTNLETFGAANGEVLECCKHSLMGESSGN